jgi:hypothetical protein
MTGQEDQGGSGVSEHFDTWVVNAIKLLFGHAINWLVARNKSQSCYQRCTTIEENTTQSG